MCDSLLLCCCYYSSMMKYLQNSKNKNKATITSLYHVYSLPLDLRMF